jgi:hypothetical protein
MRVAEGVNAMCCIVASFDAPPPKTIEPKARTAWASFVSGAQCTRVGHEAVNAIGHLNLARKRPSCTTSGRIGPYLVPLFIAAL